MYSLAPDPHVCRDPARCPVSWWKQVPHMNALGRSAIAYQMFDTGFASPHAAQTRVVIGGLPATTMRAPLNGFRSPVVVTPV